MFERAKAGKAGQATILLAVDGSEFGVGATRIAKKLAAEDGAKLVVLRALTSGADEGVMGIDARAAEEAEARAVIERIADETRRAGGSARAMTKGGSSPANAILAAAKQVGADMIVVGRRGPRGLALGTLGHTTARVIGSATCPVLVAPRAAQPWRRTILLATDGSPAAEAAALTLAHRSCVGGAPIMVLSVEAPSHSPQRRAEAAVIVERTVAALRAAGREADGKVAQGVPTDMIVAAAAEADADLVVIGSEGRTPLRRAMLGSNSETVIARVPCAALVVTARMARELKQ